MIYQKYYILHIFFSCPAIPWFFYAPHLINICREYNESESISQRSRKRLTVTMKELQRSMTYLGESVDMATISWPLWKSGQNTTQIISFYSLPQPIQETQKICESGSTGLNRLHFQYLVCVCLAENKETTPNMKHCCDSIIVWSLFVFSRDRFAFQSWWECGTKYRDIPEESLLEAAEDLGTGHLHRPAVEWLT